MTAKKAAWTAFLVCAALILAFYYLQVSAQTSAQTSAQAPASTQAAEGGAAAEDAGTDTGGDRGGDGQPEATGSESDSPAGVDRANGFAQPYPDAPQAPEASDPAPPKQYERQEITAPSVPAPDTQDPAAVAGAFLTVYNSRASETDQTWQETVQPWLTPDLAQQMPAVTNGALTGKTPTSVSAIEVGDNVEEWGTDTPLRWARYVQVTMGTQDQGTYLLEYRVRAQLTDQGWLINAAPLDSWQRVEK